MVSWPWDYDYFEQGVLDTIPVYDLEELVPQENLGEGYYGVVDLVVHKDEQWEAAYKHIKDEHKEDQDVRRMLVEEAKALLAFENDHIVKCLGLVYKYGGAGGPVFCGILMERMDGSFGKLLPSWPSEGVVQDVLHVLCQVLPCVASLHALGLVHRDLHPGNILIKGDLFKVADLGLSVWGRGADSKWKVGHTAVPGQFDTVPPKAQSMPHILGKFDMFTVAVVAARVALRASGAPRKVWDRFGGEDRYWSPSDKNKVLEKEVADFMLGALDKAQAVLLTHNAPKVAALLGDLGHVDRSKCPTPLEALKATYQLRKDHFGIQIPDPDTAEGKMVCALEDLRTATGKARWGPLRVLGLRCTPRNIFYATKGGGSAQAPDVDWAVAGEKELKMFCEQGDVQMVRRVMQRMREREVASLTYAALTVAAVSFLTLPTTSFLALATLSMPSLTLTLAAKRTADSYLPLFTACGKIKGESRVDKMEDLLDEMEEQGIDPSAEVLSEVLSVYSGVGNITKAEETLTKMMQRGPAYPLKLKGYTEVLVCHRNIGDLDAAEKVLDRMAQKRVYPSVVQFTQLLSGYVWKRDMQKAEALVSRMNALSYQRQRPNDYTYAILLDGYADEKLRLRQVLKQMQKKQDSLGEQQTKDEMQQVEQTMMGVLQRMREAKIKIIGERVYQAFINACGDNVEEAEGWVAKMKGEKIALSPWILLVWGKVLGRAGKTGKEMEALLGQV